MIQSRLRLTLLMVLAIVIGVAVGAMWLVRSHTLRFEWLLEDEHGAIKAANTVLFNASLVESLVLQALGPGDEGDITPDDPVLQKAADAIVEGIAILSRRAKSAPEREAIEELEALVVATRDDITEALGGGPPAGHVNRLADAFRGIARVTQRVVALNDTRIVTERDRFASRTFDAVLYVGLLTVVALIVVALIYWQFNALALQPLATLTESVREVGKRNFELSLPVHRDDEIGRLSVAYNDMAAELRRLYRETDRRIVELNARNRALLNTFPHAVIVLDDEGTLVQINPEAETILSSLGTPDRLPAKLRKPFEQALETGEDVLPTDLDQALLFRIDEQERYYLPRAFRLPPVEDMAPAWCIILTDVTRFRWLEDMKMNVLATASHEIKTPLTSIRMVLHLLLEQKTGKLTALQEEMVTSAMNDCERLLETLADLLQLARLTRGSQHLDLKALPPAKLFADLPLSLQQEAAAKEIAIKVDASEDLPLVLADEHRLAQVVTNLLSNAIRFSPPASSVALEARKQDADHVRFTVTDHGNGVPAASQDRLFERFYRDPDQNSKGTGLGLSISREIIDAHNGRIGFQSEDGQPTVFYFDLPLA